MLMYEHDVMNFVNPRKRRFMLQEDQRMAYMSRVLQLSPMMLTSKLSAEECRARRSVYHELCQIFKVPFRSVRFHLYFGRSKCQVLRKLAVACARRGEVQAIHCLFKIIEPAISIEQYLSILDQIPLVTSVKSIIPILPTCETCRQNIYASDGRSVIELLADWYYKRAKDIYRFTGQIFEVKDILCQAITLLPTMRKTYEEGGQDNHGMKCQQLLLQFQSDILVEIQSIYGSLEKMESNIGYASDTSNASSSHIIDMSEEINLDEGSIVNDMNDYLLIGHDSGTISNEHYEKFARFGEDDSCVKCPLESNNALKSKQENRLNYLSFNCKPSSEHDVDIPIKGVQTQDYDCSIFSEELSADTQQVVASTQNSYMISDEFYTQKNSLRSNNSNTSQSLSLIKDRGQNSFELNLIEEKHDNVQGVPLSDSHHIVDLVESRTTKTSMKILPRKKGTEISYDFSDLSFPVNILSAMEKNISGIESDDEERESKQYICMELGRVSTDYPEDHKDILSHSRHCLSKDFDSIDFFSSTDVRLTPHSDVDIDSKEGLYSKDKINEMQRRLDELESKLKLNEVTHSMTIDSITQKLNEEKYREIRLARENILNETEQRVGDFILKMKMEVADTLFKANEEVKLLREQNMEYENIIADMKESMVFDQMKSSRKVKVLERQNDMLKKQLDRIQNEEQEFDVSVS